MGREGGDCLKGGRGGRRKRRKKDKLVKEKEEKKAPKLDHKIHFKKRDVSGHISA